MSNRLDLSLHLTMLNCRSQYSLATVGDTFSQDGFTPAKFRSNCDLAQTLSFAGQQTGCVVLVDHDQWHTKPTSRFCNQSALLRIFDRMKTGTDIKANLVTTRMQIDDDMDLRPDMIANERSNPVRDPCQRRLLTRAIDKGTIQINAICFDAVTSPRSECFDIQNGDDDDPSGHCFKTDLTE